MANKLKITDAAGNAISSVGQIKGVKPLGSQVLVELILPDELLPKTAIHVPDAGKVIQGAPQGYILDFGPMVSVETWGLEKGQRVVLSGNFTPLPEAVSDNGRPQAVVEPHSIKAVLIEG